MPWNWIPSIGGSCCRLSLSFTLIGCCCHFFCFCFCCSRCVYYFYCVSSVETLFFPPRMSSVLIKFHWNIQIFAAFLTIHCVYSLFFAENRRVGNVVLYWRNVYLHYVFWRLLQYSHWSFRCISWMSTLNVGLIFFIEATIFFNLNSLCTSESKTNGIFRIWQFQAIIEMPYARKHCEKVDQQFNQL